MNKYGPLAITGTGMTSPAGLSTAAYKTALRHRRIAISKIAGSGKSLSNSQIAGVVPLADDLWDSRLHMLASHSLEQALDHAGKCILDRRVGVVFATAISTTREMESAFVLQQGLSPQYVRFGGFTEMITKKYGLKGPSLTVSTGCTAGIDALGIAREQIILDRCDACLVVAADATLCPIVFAAFDKIGALSKRNEVTTASQPFGLGRDGFVLSEGAATLVLERVDSAIQRKVKILAELVDVASVSNAFHMTNMRTDGTDLIRLIGHLLKHNRVLANQIDLVDVHGTSTKINDLSEANALKHLFFNIGLRPYITAQKSMTGHSLGASNLVELVGLTYMLYEQFVPGLATADLLDEDLAMSMGIRNEDHPVLSYALKLSSSFSGMHSGALLRRFRG